MEVQPRHEDPGIFSDDNIIEGIFDGTSGNDTELLQQHISSQGYTKVADLPFGWFAGAHFTPGVDIILKSTSDAWE